MCHLSWPDSSKQTARPLQLSDINNGLVGTGLYAFWRLFRPHAVATNLLTTLHNYYLYIYTSDSYHTNH